MSEDLMTDADKAARILQIDELIVMLKEERDEIEQDLIANMPKKVVTFDGIGTFEKRSKSPRTEWRHEELFSAISRNVREDGRWVNNETGEVSEEPVDRFDVLRELANPSWRSTALKARGINPDEYSRTTPGGLKLQITKANS